MILFVFEGDRECPIFESIQKLFFPKEIDPFVCIYKSNIYSLYSKIKEYDAFGTNEVDTVSIINEILLEKGDHTLEDITPSSVSEIYLFFDYDFHHNRGALEENNLHLKEMLELFNEETESGKLYINYPMVESLRYTKELPDNNYHDYTIMREQCKRFKNLANQFSYYPSFDHLLVSNNKNISEEKRKRQIEQIKSNWLHLIDMNVRKANLICNDIADYPHAKSDIAQCSLFDAQLRKYVETDVSIHAPTWGVTQGF